MIIDFINMLVESAPSVKARTPHPEDAIISSSAAAAQQIAGLKAVVANPSNLTIKWDGYPAIIFGRLENGKLGMADKYMFDKGILVTSPDEWQQYDSQKAAGGLRGTLYDAAAQIWPGLDAATQSPGFFWGDLMYTGQLQPQQGKYAFKPNTVEYRIPTNSAVGKQIAGTVGGVVVHQYFKQIGAAPVQWDGKGLRSVPGGVAIISPTAGNRFTLKMPVQQERAAEAALKKYGAAVDELLGPLPQSTRDRIKTYFNKRITKQTTEELHDWLAASISRVQYNALVGENYSGTLFARDANEQVIESPGYAGLEAIWYSIYSFKENLAKQLAPQVGGIEEYVNGQPAGEGFIFPTATGLVKIVDREVFSAANFAKKL